VKAYLFLILAIILTAAYPVISQEQFIQDSSWTSTSINSDSVQFTQTDTVDTFQIKLGDLDSADYFSGEISFAYYLISSEQYSDAQYLLFKLQSESTSADPNQRDSINYLIGWTFYFSRDFDQAIDHLSNVSTQSEIGVQSQFYKSICLVYIEQYDSAKIILNNISTKPDDILRELTVLQLTAIALLERDYYAYDSLSPYLTKKYFQFSEEENSMKEYYADLTNYRQKSPWIAGGLSALFPGLGKFYAGYIGLPFGTISMTLPLAAVAVEAAIIAGVLSPPFIVLGSLFGIFYVGNIWGSALSVYTIKKEIYDEIDRNIIYDMHIPLRRVFW